MKPALVTGATGFLGCHVARVLLRRYGVVFWRVLEREADGLPPWRELLSVYRRLEARARVRERLDLHRGHTPEQREDKLRSPPLELSRAFGLRLCVALDGVRGQTVDVGEDRLGEPRGGCLVDAGGVACRGKPSPRDASADPVRGLQGVGRSPPPQRGTPHAD